MFTLICLIFLLQNSIQQDLSAITDLQTLSELPLEKLLKLKNNFEPEELPAEDPTISTKLKVEPAGDNPEALALHSKRKPYNRGGYETDYHKKKEKDTSSIFQMSVTTLAFVAFGGYLLCLIVQAIRAKNNAMDTNDTLAMLIRNPNRVKVPQRQTKPGRRPRPGNNRYKREVWPDANPQGMYDALIMLAEGYGKYHTIDYRHFNTSIKAFG